MTMQGPSTAGLGLLLPLYGLLQLCPKKYANVAFWLRPGTSKLLSLSPMAFWKKCLVRTSMWNGPGTRRQVFDKEVSFQLLVSQRGLVRPLYAYQKLCLEQCGGEGCAIYNTYLGLLSGSRGPGLPSLMPFLKKGAWNGSGEPQGTGHLTRGPIQTFHPMPPSIAHCLWKPVPSQ